MTVEIFPRRRAAPMTAAIVLTLALAGCDTTGQKQNIGTGVGAVAGGAGGYALGRAVGGTGSKIAGTIIGGLVGAYIGGEVGRSLDERDREEAAYATEQALERSYADDGYVEPVSWRSDRNSDVYGETRIVRSGVRNGQECRLAREVAYIRGEEIVQETTYCRDSEGRWRTI